MKKIGLVFALVVCCILPLVTSGCGTNLDTVGATASEGQPPGSWLEFVLEANPADATTTSEEMDVAASVLQERILSLGIESFEIQREGDWRIRVVLPGIEDEELALIIGSRTGALEFFPVAEFGEEYATAREALNRAGAVSADDLAEGQRLIWWPEDANLKAWDTYYLVTTEPVMDGSMVKDAGYDNLTSVPGTYRVTIEFDSEGAEAFRAITRELADIRLVTGVIQSLAIVLDGTVLSAPTVEEEIAGGRAEITGTFTLEEARELALVLQTGALPVGLVVVSKKLAPGK